MPHIAKTRQVQLLHVLSRSVESYRNMDGDSRTKENVESSWMAPVTITRLADKDTVIRLVCTEPGCKHQEQDVHIKSIKHVAANRLRFIIVAIIFFAITCMLGGGIPIFLITANNLIEAVPALSLLGICFPFSLFSFIAAVAYTFAAFNYQGIDLLTPREGLGHAIKNEQNLVV